MTGTSLDGIDGVLARFSPDGHPYLAGSATLALPKSLQAQFTALNTPGPNELEIAAQAGIELARLYAQVCHQLLDKHALKPDAIRAIGAHGQTVRHAPQLGYSIQINAPATLAELTGIDVVADFRSRDIAAGGQGAPLVPAFHQALFSGSQARIILNLGGIANITLLDPRGALLGFDTGPANTLLDSWCLEKTGKPFDDNGRWAQGGRCHQGLLEQLLSEPWFALPPPKSTGRDLFNRQWLDTHMGRLTGPAPSDIDVQATLLQLTVHSICKALARHAPQATEIIVCGGGANNGFLLQQLQTLSGLPVNTSDKLGVPPQQVEALAFAWLARAHVTRQKPELSQVTGARGNRLPGCLYPA